jgi:hypothetical protein
MTAPISNHVQSSQTCLNLLTIPVSSSIRGAQRLSFGDIVHLGVGNLLFKLFQQLIHHLTKMYKGWTARVISNEKDCD